ncbi:MAG: hypothetical protein IIB54_12280 [Planctomycetes bacterium]|nr:hypothetical protein [Planctomycetota bacterium]
MANPSAGTDEHTIKLLSQARQGKACKFVMIVKGDTILRLRVFCQGEYEAQIQAAKDEGHDGDSYWGVVSGSGADLTFYLSPADGFDSPPVEAMIFKAFLLEEAQLEVNPTFAFVAELPAVTETQDEVAAVVVPVDEPEIISETVDEPVPAADPSPVPEPAPTPAPAPEPEPEPEKTAEDDEQTRAAKREAQRKFIADSYRNLPTPLKFTFVDIAAGKCAKITPENRDTTDAMQSYRNLMSECADWIRSDDALEHRDQVTTIKAILDAAKAEYLAIKAAIA